MTEHSFRFIPRHRDIIDRRDLTVPHEIQERMARDILTSRREGVAGLVDLTEHGWTQAQVARYGANAHDLARDVGFATQDVVDRQRATDEAAEAAVTRAVAPGGASAAPHTGDMTEMVETLATQRSAPFPSASMVFESNPGCDACQSAMSLTTHEGDPA